MSDSVILSRCLLSSSIRKSMPQEGVFILGATDIESFNSCDFPVIETSSSQEVCGEENSDKGMAFPSLKEDSKQFPWLYPIVDRAQWISKLGNNKLNIIQLRIKDLKEALERNRAVSLSKKYKVRLFVNDYWELALKYGAYGVHLGQEDLNSADLAKIKRAGLALGLSSHSYEEGAIAKGISPSYIALGPIYFTKLKAMNFSPQGIMALKTWKNIRLPHCCHWWN